MKTFDFTLKFNLPDPAADAILGALRDVTRAIPGAALVEAAPDFVGLTDVARFLGCSRQSLLEVARAAQQVNLAREMRDAVPALQRRAQALVGG